MSDNARVTGDGANRSEFRFEREFAIRFYEAIGTDLALCQALRLNNSQDPCELSINSCNYQEPEHFAEDYQVTELLKKSYHIPGHTIELRKARALAKLLAAEQHNLETNERLWMEALPEWFGEFSHQLLRILGPLDATALNRVAELSKFGPGANVGLQVGVVVPSLKYETTPAMTKTLESLVKGFMPIMVRKYHEEIEHDIRLVKGNSHFTVPKNYKIERCAAKEPVWNSYIQAGIGRFMAARLRHFGVNLQDQTRNQYLASQAHLKGLATIDLSSASDLISRNLVTCALTYNQDPQGLRWLHLLNTARSHYMRFGREWRELQMFSSMGNGFTFPLESAIYLALVRTTVERALWKDCAVYGDDIIIPSNVARTFIERLEYLGFKVNESKTFLAGVFYESCGTDWFMGKNVRPFYLHQDPGSGIPYPLQAANALRSWCLRIYGDLPHKFHSLWKWCVGRVPNHWRHPIPKELGDVGVHVGVSAARRLGVRLAFANPDYSSMEGFVIKKALLRPRALERKRWGVLMSVLSRERTPTFGNTMRDACSPGWYIGLEDQATEGKEPVRGLFGKVRVEESVVLWKDDFEWSMLESAATECAV